MKFVDDFLNSITMYRLVFYCLIFLLVVAIVLSYFNILPFNFFALIFTSFCLTLVCWVTNKILGKIFDVPTNLESVYISALILTLIVTPLRNSNDLAILSLLAVLAMASKYFLAINKKHIFNPVAFSVVLSSPLVSSGASWWVGTPYMIIPTIIVGFLIVRKVKALSMVLTFFVTSLISVIGFNILRGNDLVQILPNIILETPILFFAFIMLVEPLTSPTTKKLQIFYGGLVGFLFAPDIHLGEFYSTPEKALLLGNIFSYIVNPKEKLLLKLKERKQIALDVYDFVFALDKPMKYVAGQYMEWTLAHKAPDNRGVRRYFTLASSPSENSLRIGVKFYPNGSSFKRSLVSLNSENYVAVSQLSGEFTLPQDLTKKLCFIAGGIGITPFRSMIKYLLDTNQERDIILLYSNKNKKEIVYKEVFDQAFKKLGIKTIYVNTDLMGYIDEALLKKEVSDYKKRTFYLSGPHSMVDAFENILQKMGLPSKQIKTDFFPGYA